MRVYDVEELKETLKLLEGDTDIVSPMARGRAFEIAKYLMRQEIKRMENGEEIEEALCREPKMYLVEERKRVYKEGWADGTKALLEVMTRCFTG